MDLLAGLTGAVAGAPQAMGFAILAGVSPLYGLYGAFVTAIIASMLSSSALIAFAPTNSLALVAGSALLVTSDAQQLDVLLLLSILTGVFMLVIGMLRLGNLTRFVSRAVMTGFITGAGVLIILGQLSNLTGVDVQGTSIPVLKVVQWVAALPESDYQTTIIGVAAVIMIGTLQYTRLRSYAPLMTIFVLTGFTMFAGWDGVKIVRDMSEIPSGFPAPFIPDISLAPGLLTTALAMSILAAVQSAALIDSTRQNEKHPVNVSRDFLAMGVSNIVGGIFRSMPTCASLSRTAVNISAGAQTRLANLSASAFIGLMLFTFAGFIEQIPLAVLAGHLVVAAVSLISVRDLKVAWRVDVKGRSVMIVTLLTALLLPLEYSIYIGVGLSLLLYVYTSAQNVHLIRLVPTGDGHFRTAKTPDTLPKEEVVVLSVHGHLFFAAVRELEKLLPHPGFRTVVILRLRENMYLGSTGIEMLNRYRSELERHGGRLLITGMEPSVLKQLERTGALEMFGRENVYFADEVVFGATERAYNWAKAWLSEQSTPTEA